MEYTHTAYLDKRKKGDLLVLPYWKGKKTVRSAFSQKIQLPRLVEEVAVSDDFKGKEGEVLLLYVEGQPEKRFCLLGLGESEKASVESLRRSYGAVTKTCLAKRLKQINLVVPEVNSLEIEHVVQGVAEGLLLPNYLFNRHKNSGQDEIEESLLQGVCWIAPGKEVLEAVKRLDTICGAVVYTRDLVNESADIVTPQKLAECAKEIAKSEKGVSATIWGKKQIEAEKLNLLLAVSRGADVDPAFIVLEYRGNPRSKDKTILVGKGVTYDTGGLNLKPTGSMETMKCDMAGAAVCLGVIKAVSELKMKLNVTAVIPTTENGIDAKSFKPGDVYTSYAGKTVEMTNSDAEGRLILADALAYAVKNLDPSRIIDIATLTGAIEIALGPEAAGMMSTDNGLADALIAAGERTFERLWRMPLYDEYVERLKSDIADLKSWNGRAAGANVAATFLRQFVGDSVPWAHIDIAATAYVSEAKRYVPKYGTGYGVRLIVDFLQQIESR